MVKVTLDLSELDIEIFLNCIEVAIDTKYITGKDAEDAKKIIEQLKKYL